MLFVIIWWFTSKPRPRLAPSGLFLLLLWRWRASLVEFVRVPDEHIGYLAGGWLTMGQLLSLPMMLVGLALLVHGLSAARCLPAISRCVTRNESSTSI